MPDPQRPIPDVDPSSPPGLTTTKAPFIEGARSRGELFITQPHELYSPENHQSWRNLYARMRERWERCANHRFLEGLGALGLSGERIPRLEEVNQFLAPLTGFRRPALPLPARVGGESGLPHRPLPAPPLHRGFLRPPLPGGE